MKTTNQDPKLNQKDSATEVDQKSKQAEAVSAVPKEANVAVDLDNQYVGDQLDLPLVVTDTLAMASDSVDEVKKRKEKKDESEQNASQPEVDDEVVNINVVSWIFFFFCNKKFFCRSWREHESRVC